MVTVRQAVNQALMLSGHLTPDATYTTTAQMVTDMAITKLSHVNQSGTIDPTREAKYYGMAPHLLADLQASLCHEENQFERVTPPASMSSVLSLSDDNATRILPTGLAMAFALSDQNILAYNALSQEYYQSKLPELTVLITGDAHKYAKAAPSYCDMLQAELLHLEGTHTGADPLQTMDDYLSVTDDTAVRVLPVGLAWLFAVIDENGQLSQALQAQYMAAKQQISAGTSTINDHYNTLLDPNMMY